MYCNGSPTAFQAALASPDPATAFNPIGDGSLQLNDLQQFQEDDDRGNRSTRQKVLTFNVDGGLFELPAGELRVAMGGEIRTDRLDFEDFGLNPFTFRFPDAPAIVPNSRRASEAPPREMPRKLPGGLILEYHGALKHCSR